MPYADTDFFLALIKESDWLKSSAKKLLDKYHKHIWTSVATIAELLLLCAEFKLDPERVVSAVVNIAEVKGMTKEEAVASAHYMSEDSLTPLDAMHAAFCGSDEIISSDQAFSRIGLKRIPLEEK